MQMNPLTKVFLLLGGLGIVVDVVIYVAVPSMHQMLPLGSLYGLGVLILAIIIWFVKDRQTQPKQRTTSW